MNKPIHQRPSYFKRRLFVDFKTQGLLLLYTWLILLLGIVLHRMILFSGEMPVENVSVLGRLLQNRPLVIAISTTALSLSIIFYVAFTNRIIGPIVRFQNHLSKLVENPDAEIREIHFRKDDHFTILAAKYNLLLARLKTAEEKSNKNILGDAS